MNELELCQVCNEREAFFELELNDDGTLTMYYACFECAEELDK